MGKYDDFGLLPKIKIRYCLKNLPTDRKPLSDIFWGFYEPGSESRIELGVD